MHIAFDFNDCNKQISKSLTTRKSFCVTARGRTACGVSSLAHLSGKVPLFCPGWGEPLSCPGGYPLSCLARVPPVLSEGWYPVLSWLGYCPERTWDQRLGRDLGPEAGIPPPPGRTWSRTLDRTSGRTRGTPPTQERTWDQRLEKGPGTRGRGTPASGLKKNENITSRSYFVRAIPFASFYLL